MYPWLIRLPMGQCYTHVPFPLVHLTGCHSHVNKSAFIPSVIYASLIHRLYSDYLYFASANKSVEDFHEKVAESLQLFENCMLDYSLRACVYNNTLNNAMPVRISKNV